MDTFTLILEIAILVVGVVVVGIVLMQQGKAHGLSGAIAGGADTFFGKEKGKQFSSKLAKITTWLAIAFVVFVFILYVLSPEIKHSSAFSSDNWTLSPYAATTVTEFVKL